jgi:hypothetical protein
MAKTRSPNYPRLDLSAALALARKAFEEDHRNKMSKTALANHLGHEGLSGPALSKIGVLRTYGLVEGSGDELRITDDAVTALMAPEGSSGRDDALRRLAEHPSLFREIRKEYPTTLPSVSNLTYWLIKRDYTQEAAAQAAKAYLNTMRLVFGPEGDHNKPEPQDDSAMPMQKAARHQSSFSPAQRPPSSVAPIPATGTRQEVITLDEGDVIVSFPETLSAESFDDLKDHLELFIRRMQRRTSRRRLTEEDRAWADERFSSGDGEEDGAD